MKNVLNFEELDNTDQKLIIDIIVSIIKNKINQDQED